MSRALFAIAAVLALVQQVPVFRTGVDLVHVGVTVTDRKGAPISDLTAADFTVLEDGKPQTVRYFTSGESTGERPDMHLGLLLDTSESMGDDIQFTKTAAIKFLNTLTDAVDITVVDFDTEVRLARYGQSEFARVIERIRGHKAAGWTALYDAVGVYLDGAAEQQGRKIMLLYTDGGDTRSSMSLSELTDLLKASDVTVYAIGELEHQRASDATQARAVLQRIAGLTAGQAFFPLSVKSLDDAYAKVLAEIRAQSSIGYQSANEKFDGAWRKVEIKVSRKGDYRVRARAGYFAPYRKP